jgi:hypothetical protein
MSAQQTCFDQKTRAKLIDFSMEVERLVTPDEVLSRLHDIISENNPLRVLGANRFAVKIAHRHSELGRNVFIHQDVPRGWRDEWTAFVTSGRCTGLMTARICLASFTWSELV